jgi:hypothetical protein
VGAVAGSFAGSDDKQEAAPAAPVAAAAAAPSAAAHCDVFQTDFMACLREVRCCGVGVQGRALRVA